MKIGDKVWGCFVDHEVALDMAAKKVGRSQEQLQLHPKDVRKSLQGNMHGVLQDAKWFRHLYRAYSGIYGPAYIGYFKDTHHRAHSGSEILAHPNVIVHLLLAKSGYEDMKQWIAGPGRQTMLHSGIAEDIVSLK